MKKKIRTVEAESRAFAPTGVYDSIDINHSVCVRVTNYDDFMLWFATDSNRKEKYFSPYKILSELEDLVIKDYLYNGCVKGTVLSSYKKHDIGDAIFDFEGFCYEEKSKTLIIDYSYATSVS